MDNWLLYVHEVEYGSGPTWTRSASLPLRREMYIYELLVIARALSRIVAYAVYNDTEVNKHLSNHTSVYYTVLYVHIIPLCTVYYALNPIN
jgi:hypothetical protein